MLCVDSSGTEENELKQDTGEGHPEHCKTHQMIYIIHSLNRQHSTANKYMIYIIHSLKRQHSIERVLVDGNKMIYMGNDTVSYTVTHHLSWILT